MDPRAELGDELVEATVEDVDTRGMAPGKSLGTPKRLADGERRRTLGWVLLLALLSTVDVVVLGDGLAVGLLSGGLRPLDAARKRLRRPIVMGAAQSTHCVVAEVECGTGSLCRCGIDRLARGWTRGW